MAPAELSAANVTALCNKSEGRDKVARFVQYLARTIMGLTNMTQLKAGTQLYNLNEYSGNVMKQLAGARRTHRWCKEVPVIKAILTEVTFANIPASMPTLDDVPRIVDKGLELLQKMTLTSFLIIDHLGWLKQVKLISGGRRAGTGTIQLGLKFFCASNCLGMLHQLKRLRDVSQQEGQEAKKKVHAQNAAKHAFLVVQTAHLSRSYETHDALVGFLGMITSGMDVLAQWPERKSEAAVKASPDAKALASKKD